MGLAQVLFTTCMLVWSVAVFSAVSLGFEMYETVTDAGPKVPLTSTAKGTDAPDLFVITR